MLVMGRIVAPFGVKGWVRIQPFSDDLSSWRKLPKLWLCANENADATQWQAVTVKACRAHGKGLVASFDEVPNRTAAEALGRMFVGAEREALPEPSGGEYYWADLIGLEVRNTVGEALGRVGGLLETGAHDVLRVEFAEGERLIPFVAAHVQRVDLTAGTITVEWGSDW